ncbi:NNMT/PNMT/TEMT family protein [Dirofilaria immitis]|nr:NNMT/PNMT/TEMT family protein [Dirofilaria immitis]
MIPKTANSKAASSFTINSISQEQEEKSLILTETSHNYTPANDTVLQLCSAAEQAVNVRNFSTNCNNAYDTLFSSWNSLLDSRKIRTLLDLGAGPTVYVPITFRKHAKHIYSADYAESSCDMLKNWAKNKSSFEWTEICKWIACIENSDESPDVMEQSARSRFKAVLRADVHAEPIIKCVHYKCSDNDDIPKQFHVVVSIFCLEYSSENLKDYRHAVRNAVNLIEPNGFLIQGGVLQANDYYFGNKRYKCHHLTREHVIESLKENNMAVEKDENFKWIEFDKVFLLVARKKVRNT